MDADYHKKYYLKRRAELLQRAKDNYWANVEERRAYHRAHANKMRPTRKEYYRAWCEANAEKIQIRNRQASKQWREQNPHLNAAKSNSYRARKLNAQPDWLSVTQLNEMKMIYATCPKGWHVDHIVPLKGTDVCGLHVPWNLQHLPASQNMRKSNKA